MSPPIRDGSGSSIGSIRLGDGSEISEVRTGAGDVVFDGGAIPDSVVWNSAAADYDGSAWADSLGGSNTVPDTNGNPSVVSGVTPSGDDAVRYDDSVPDTSKSTDTFATVDPIAIIWAGRVRTTNSNSHIFDGENLQDFQLFHFADGDFFIRRGGDQKQGASASLDSEWHIWTLEGFNDTDIRLYIDGTNVLELSDSSNTADLTGLSIARRADKPQDDEAADHDFAEISISEGHTQSQRIDEEQRLADKYGITI